MLFADAIPARPMGFVTVGNGANSNPRRLALDSVIMAWHVHVEERNNYARTIQSLTGLQRHFTG